MYEMDTPQSCPTLRATAEVMHSIGGVSCRTVRSPGFSRLVGYSESAIYFLPVKVAG